MGADITEKQFEAQVKDLAKIYRWLYYHTWRSIHSPAGFPDVVMVRPPRLIFAELKSEKGELTPEQKEWLITLWLCQDISRVAEDWTLEDIAKLKPGLLFPEVYLWRPSQIEEIAEVLK